MITALVVAATLLPVVVMGSSVELHDRATRRRIHALARPDGQLVTRTARTNKVATQRGTPAIMRRQGWGMTPSPPPGPPIGR